MLTAYHNAGGDIDLQKALGEMISRGSKVPGGACGFWGACGAAISTGMFISIITGVRIQKSQVVCRHMSSDSQCIGKRCPFYPQINKE